MTHRTTARHGLAGAALLGLLGATGERGRKPAPRRTTSTRPGGGRPDQSDGQQPGEGRRA